MNVIKNILMMTFLGFANTYCADVALFASENKKTNERMFQFILKDNDEKNIGTIDYYFLDQETIEILKLELDQKREERKGFGKKLLMEFENFIIVNYKNIKKIKIESLDDVVGFYQKCGYFSTGQVSADCLIFEKILKN